MSYIVRMVDSGQLLSWRMGRQTDYGITMLITLPDGRTAEVEYTGPDEPKPAVWFNRGTAQNIDGDNESRPRAPA